MKINPLKDTNAKDTTNMPRKKLTAGKKIFAPIGVSYIKPRDKVILEITSVVVKDLEDNDEEGCFHRESFWLTPAAGWKVANWSIAMGNTEPFDASSREDIERIIGNGVAFHGVISIKEDNGYENRNIDNFYRPNEIMNKGEIEISESIENIIKGAEDFFPELIKRRKQGGTKFIESDSKENNDSEIPF